MPRGLAWGWICAVGLVLSGCAAGSAQKGVLPTLTLRSLPSLQPGASVDAMQCVAVSGQPTPAATETSIFPAPGAGDHSLGPDTAVITFLEYTDYQAPASAALDSALEQLARKYPQDVRRVFRHYPLPTNNKSMLAAAAAEAAAKQGKFWEMSALLTGKQAQWTGLEGSAFQDWLAAAAAGLGLDASQFSRDMRDSAIAAELSQAQHFGMANSIPTIPFLLVNHQIYQGPRDLNSLETLVNLSRLESRQFSDCPPFVIDLHRQYFADVQTNKGKIVLQLFPTEAPMAVNNFVFLSRKGWYDNVIFHRVIAGDLAQAGDPSGTGYGSPGYAFADEISGRKFDRPGLLAMANAGPDSNGSQFFITSRALPKMDGHYTVFGQVMEGQEVVDSLQPRDPSQAGALPAGDTILKIEIREQ